MNWDNIGILLLLELSMIQMIHIVIVNSILLLQFIDQMIIIIVMIMIMMIMIMIIW